MTKLLLILIAAWLLIQPVNAQDNLNVIRVNAPAQSFQLDNIDKITFDTESIYIEQTDNFTSNFFFNDVVMLTFLNLTAASEKLQTQNKSDINIFYSVMLDNVTVNNSSPIKQITVYNMLGYAVKELKPNTSYAEISLQDMPRGLYIVNAITVESKVSKKIIKQ